MTLKDFGYVNLVKVLHNDFTFDDFYNYARDRYAENVGSTLVFGADLFENLIYLANTRFITIAPLMVQAYTYITSTSWSGSGDIADAEFLARYDSYKLNNKALFALMKYRQDSSVVKCGDLDNWLYQIHSSDLASWLVDLIGLVEKKYGYIMVDTAKKFISYVNDNQALSPYKITETKTPRVETTIEDENNFKTTETNTSKFKSTTTNTDSKKAFNDSSFVEYDKSETVNEGDENDNETTNTTEGTSEDNNSKRVISTLGSDTKTTIGNNAKKYTNQELLLQDIELKRKSLLEMWFDCFRQELFA